MADLRVNDVGVSIEVKLSEDVGDATTLELLLLSPYDTPKSLTASLDDSDSPRLVKYITEDGDFDISGRWQCQIRVVQFGMDRRSSSFIITVERALDA